MSLSEKAKTLPEWHEEVRKKGETDCGSCLSIGTKDACSDCTVILNFHPKFVRLEVAQQEIDRINKICNEMSDEITNCGEQKQKLDKLKLWVFGLYKKADHLSHEDERQSCAYLLRDLFGVETEEGTFGELFLTDKAQKELEELLK